MVDGDSFFAKIDSARDDVGHFYPPWRSATLTVRVGQEIQIMVSATDPYEAELDYSFQFASGPITWQKSPSFNLVFRESHIARQQALIIRVRSPRNTGPVYESDHMINWHYCVLP